MIHEFKESYLIHEKPENEFFLKKWEKLICALKARVNESNIVIFCWNVCIEFNF